MKTDRCRGKVAWRSKDEAEYQLQSLKRGSHRNKKQINKLETYKCPTCHYWHIGTNRYKRKRLPT